MVNIAWQDFYGKNLVEKFLQHKICGANFVTEISTGCERDLKAI